MPPIIAPNPKIGAKNRAVAREGGGNLPEGCREGTPVLRDRTGLLDCFSSSFPPRTYATPRSRAAPSGEANRLCAPHLHGARAGGFTRSSSRGAGPACRSFRHRLFDRLCDSGARPEPAMDRRNSAAASSRSGRAGGLSCLSHSFVAFWFVYLFVELAAGIRWGTRRSVILAGVVTFALLIRTALNGPLAWEKMISWIALSTGTFFAGAGMSFLGSRQRRHAAEQEFLAHLTGLLEVDRGMAESLRLVLDRIGSGFRLRRSHPCVPRR